MMNNYCNYPMFITKRDLTVLKSLEGRLALRTIPDNRMKNSFAPGFIKDFTTVPIEIVHVSDTHIVYRPVSHTLNGLSVETRSLSILNIEYLDDNWVSYDELIEVADTKLAARGIIRKELFHPGEPYDDGEDDIPAGFVNMSKEDRRKLFLDKILNDGSLTDKEANEIIGDKDTQSNIPPVNETVNEEQPRDTQMTVKPRRQYNKRKK